MFIYNKTGDLYCRFWSIYIYIYIYIFTDIHHVLGFTEWIWKTRGRATGPDRLDPHQLNYLQPNKNFKLNLTMGNVLAIEQSRRNRVWKETLQYVWRKIMSILSCSTWDKEVGLDSSKPITCEIYVIHVNFSKCSS